MKNKYRVISIVRTFNNRGIVEAIKSLLSANVDLIGVAINTDVENRGEKDGAFTKELLKSAFGPKLDDRIIIHPVTNWGRNPGSAAALNDTITEVFYRTKIIPGERDIIFNISVESQISAEYIKEALDLFERFDSLAVVGVKRKISIGNDEESSALEEKFRTTILQYRIPQNTAAFWRANLLRLTGGFRTECDFSGFNIEIGGQQVPVAGMEDFPTLLSLVKSGYKWAMIGEKNPMIWDLREVRKDPQRWQINLNKMNRQETVIGIWGQKFHGLTMGQCTSILEKGQLKL